LLRHVHRLQIKGTGVRGRSNPDEEPNFDEMPFVRETGPLAAARRQPYVTEQGFYTNMTMVESGYATSSGFNSIGRISEAGSSSQSNANHASNASSHKGMVPAKVESSMSRPDPHGASSEHRIHTSFFSVNEYGISPQETISKRWSTIDRYCSLPTTPSANLDSMSHILEPRPLPPAYATTSVANHPDFISADGQTYVHVTDAAVRPQGHEDHRGQIPPRGPWL
jgi:hypothetical protein